MVTPLTPSLTHKSSLAIIFISNTFIIILLLHLLFNLIEITFLGKISYKCPVYESVDDRILCLNLCLENLRKNNSVGKEQLEKSLVLGRKLPWLTADYQLECILLTAFISILISYHISVRYVLISVHSLK